MRTAATGMDVERVRRIVLDGLRDHPARVFLFGSRAEGRASRSSDIDVGILPIDPLPRGLLTELREILENSTVLPTVDLVDLSDVEPDFRDRVIREGVAWTI
jgi:hypothetical protein